jgi:hypothetical protein
VGGRPSSSWRKKPGRSFKLGASRFGVTTRHSDNNTDSNRIISDSISTGLRSRKCK